MSISAVTRVAIAMACFSVGFSSSQIISTDDRVYGRWLQQQMLACEDSGWSGELMCDVLVLLVEGAVRREQQEG